METLAERLTSFSTRSTSVLTVVVTAAASCAVESQHGFSGDVAVVSFAVEIGLDEKEDWRGKVAGRVEAINADAFAGANAAGLGTTAVRLFQGAAGADPFTARSVTVHEHPGGPPGTEVLHSHDDLGEHSHGGFRERHAGTLASGFSVAATSTQPPPPPSTP